MSNKDFIEIPSIGVWHAMKEVKNRDIRHLKVTSGENTTILDSPVTINLQIIPRIFTAPLQAVGLVTSIFARMTNTKITLHMKDDEDQPNPTSRI